MSEPIHDVTRTPAFDIMLETGKHRGRCSAYGRQARRNRTFHFLQLLAASPQSKSDRFSCIDCCSTTGT